MVEGLGRFRGLSNPNRGSLKRPLNRYTIRVLQPRGVIRIMRGSFKGPCKAF